MNENANIIELKHITKTFDSNFAAVRDFSLEIKKGEFVTLLGPSGCGKTTTLRMIAGFEFPSEGEILLNGKDIAALPPHKRPVNTVFQRYALFPHMNIFENIAFGLKQKKMDPSLIENKVKKVLDLVDLEGFEERSINTLSGGQQQRVAIARALVNEPEILLLDEPLGALDLKMRKEMQLELKAMHKDLGITFIYVTHDQEEALTMSDKIVVMSEGRIQQVGTPEDIYNEPKNPFVADFIGESNLFNGIMTDKMKARFCGGEFECVDDIAVGTRITAVVRPEDIDITTPENGTIKGQVISVIFKGIHYEITVESGNYEVVIQSIKAPKVGEVIGMNVDPDEIHIMLADNTTNEFLATITSDYRLEYNGIDIQHDLSEILKGSKFDSEQVLHYANGDVVDTSRLKVTALVEPQYITMTDDQEGGLVQGTIRNLIYKGDHYSYVINTESGHDFFADDEYLWNMGDKIGLIISTDKMTFRIGK